MIIAFVIMGLVRKGEPEGTPLPKAPTAE
jgi:hypothetical protein